jgi:hypothetical protein
MNRRTRLFLTVLGRAVCVSVLLLLFSACMEPVGPFDNPYDPENPDSPFSYDLSAVSGTGDVQAAAESGAVRFEWSAVDHATMYHLQVARDGRFSDFVHDDEVPPGTTAVDVELEAESRYFWRVRYEAEVTRGGTTSESWGLWYGPWEVTVTSEDSGGDGDATVDQVSTPRFTPTGGTYDADQSVEITTETEGAAIYYTTDGSEPTPSSNEYTEPISVAGDGTSVTVRAIAVLDGYTDSTVEQAAYSIDYGEVDESEPDPEPDPEPDTVSTPRFTPTGGTYDADQSVEITTETAGATVYYTTDGSEPTPSSNEYTEPVSVSGDGTSVTIKAIAVLDGYTDSTVEQAAYAINYEQVSTPQFTPTGGTYNADQSVEITTETAGATIYYTTDGSDPEVNASGTSEYTEPISVSGNGTSVTVKAIAMLDGYTESTVAEAIYTIAYETTPVTVTVLVDMPEQPTVSFSGQQLSLTYGTTMTVSATITESPDEPPTWYMDGVSATTGESYTTDSSLTTGPHSITMVVMVGGIPYTETIDFEVVTP